MNQPNKIIIWPPPSKIIEEVNATGSPESVAIVVYSSPKTLTLNDFPPPDLRPIVQVVKFEHDKISFFLETYEEEIIELFRLTKGRLYVNATKHNVFPAAELINLLPKLAIIAQVKWLDDTWDKYDEFRNRKDYHIKFNHNKSKIQFEAQHSRVTPLYTQHITSFEKDWRSSHCYVALAEAHRIPEEMKYWEQYASFKVAEDVKDFITKQLEKRTLLLELSTAKEVDLPIVDELLKEGILKIPLKPAQKVALAYASMIDDRIIVSYDMGMGKTAIAITFIEMLSKKLGRPAKAIILCPSTLKRNWEIEIKKFVGKSAYVFSGIKPDNIAIDCLFKYTSQYNIINYDIIGRGDKDTDTQQTLTYWPKYINLAKFDIAIYDEGHYMKNMESQRSKGGRELDTPYSMILTGTPITNRPAEIYPLLTITNKETFHNFAAFESQFLDSKGQSKNDKAFRDMLSLYTIRRKRDPVEVERINQVAELSTTAREHYQKVLEGIYVALRDPSKEYSVTNILSEILRLKQICSSSKIELASELAMDFIQNSEEGEDKVIIFSQFLDTIKHLTKALGSNVMVLTGETTTDERYSIIDKFQNDPTKKILIASTKASSEGITLTAGHCVIFCDLMWTPTSHAQAEGRCFGRINDPHGGVAYYLLGENTIEDEFIYPLLQRKMSMIDRLVDNVHQDADENESIVKELIRHLRGF